ncbi:MAG: hypothetical protein QXJ24_06625, partial [Thermoplasmatales archaeon]
AFDGNSLANTGLDMTQTSPEASNASVFERLWFTDTFSSSNYKMIMNGQADCFLNQINFSTGSNANQQDLLWQSIGSSGYLFQCHSYSKVGYNVALQQASFEQCLMGNVWVSGTTELLLFKDCYFIGKMSQASIYITGNWYIPVMIFDGTYLAISETQPLLNWGYNYPTIDSVIFRGCSIAWNTSSPTPLLPNNNSLTIFGVKSLVVEECNTSLVTPANAESPDLSFVSSATGGTNYIVTLASKITDGTTAGTVTASQVAFTPNYKKVMLTFSGYENDTATNQTVNFPFAFSTVANITANTTGLTITASTTSITITAPNNTTTYSGTVIVEGY